MHLQDSAPAIGRLPPEMLEHVFELLPLVDRHSASLVCLKWQQILAQDHFIVESVLSVRPTTLDSDWSLRRMKRPFRRIVINSEGLEAGWIWKQFSGRVKELLSSKVIRESVQDLRVFTSVEASNEIFGRQVLKLTKLQELTYSPVWQRRSVEGLIPRIAVLAPSLDTLKIDCVNACCVELVRLLAPRLKRCVLRFFEKGIFLDIMAIASFDRLEEFSIQALSSGAEEAVPVEKILSGDVGNAFRKNFGKLDKLDVRDKVNMFPYVYHLMFNAAPNLTFLNVEGIEMHPLALHATNNLQKLRVLQLMVSTTYQAWQSDVELNLPELQVLLLFPKLMARAGNLPKLQKFALHNHGIHSGFLESTAIAALKSFTTLQTIKLVHLRDIVLTSAETLEVITNFRSPPPQIILEDIWDHINVLHQIVNSYPGLKVLHLIRCRFKADEEDPAIGEQSDDSEWETVWQAESVGRTIEFYSLSRLAEMFPNCAVDVHDSYFMKHIERAVWKQEGEGSGGDGQGKC